MKTALYLTCFIIPMMISRAAAQTSAPDTFRRPPGDSTGKFFNLVQREAAFEGGDVAWNDWIRKEMMKHLRYLERKKAYGRVLVQFVVERDGSIGNISLVNSSGTELDDVVLKIMNDCPRWTPAIQHDKPIRAFRRQWFELQPPD